MKTAEEKENDMMLLIGRLSYCAETKDWKRFARLLEEHDEIVSLDAFKAGMTRAAELLRPWVKDGPHNRIITTRDNTTTL